MKSLAILDKLPAPLRHSVIMVIGYLFAQLSIIQTGGSISFKTLWHGLLGIVVAQATLFITPLTNQYGVGKSAA